MAGSDDHAGTGGRRVGVFIASGIGGFTHIEREHKALLDGGPRKISPFFIPSAIINLAAGQVSIRYGAKGPNSATCTACSASAHAIGDAFEIIKRGDADVMIAGGSEAAITPMGIGGFGALRALSHAQRRAGTGQPAVRQGPRRLRRRRRRRRADPRGARVGAARAAHASTPSWSATACRPTPTTSPRRPRTATAAFRVMRGDRERRHYARRGRLHQRPRHLDAAGRHGRDAAIKRCFGEHAKKLPCRRPSR